MTELEVRLSANIKDLEANLKRAKGSLDKFGDTAEKQSVKGSKGFKTVGKGAANAVPAVTEFSRVIQDAPFGIQGVANNIQQLTGNFGYLVTSAGGAGNALKLMVSSLAGPAGVLLAVSVVTSALTYMANEGIGKATTAAEKLAKKQEELAKSLDDYRQSLLGVNKARLEGNRSAAEELVKLRLLKTQIEDTNLSQEERKDGIKQLQKEFPGYFKNVTEEGLLNGSLTKIYDKLTTSILKRAKATAASSLLVENARKEIILNQQIDDSKQAQVAKELELQKAKQKGASASTNALVGGAGSFNAKLVEQGVIQEDINGLTKDQVDLQKQLSDIAEENAKLASFVQANITVDPKITIDTEKLKSEFGKYKFGDAFLAEAFAITPEAQDLLTQKATDTGLKIGEGINRGLQDGAKPVKAYLSDIELALIDFNKRADDIIKNNISNTFADLGQAIGQSLITGGDAFQEIGKVLLGGLGSVLIQLGELAIATGVGLLAVQTALSTLNPGVAIAAGVALVAIGSAFSAGASSLGSSGSGGSFGGSSSVAGQGTGGNISNSGSNFGASNSSGGTVVFEIQGQKLVGVLNRTLGANARLGGNLSLG